MKIKEMIKNNIILNTVWLMLILGFAINANALESYKTNRVYFYDGLEFRSQIPGGGITILSAKTAVENNEGLQNLLYGINPTVIISTEGIGKDSDEIPVIANCNDDAINLLYEEHEDFNNVKAIIIMINDPGYSRIDLSLLKSFESLEYVLISFTFDICGNNNDSCLLSLIQNMISPGTTEVTVLYELSIPN